jgi:hypothetical protein
MRLLEEQGDSGADPAGKPNGADPGSAGSDKPESPAGSLTAAAAAAAEAAARAMTAAAGAADTAAATTGEVMDTEQPGGFRNPSGSGLVKGRKDYYGSGYSSTNSNNSDYSSALSGCEKNSLPPLYYTVQKARANAMAPRILGGGRIQIFLKNSATFPAILGMFFARTGIPSAKKPTHALSLIPQT